MQIVNIAIEFNKKQIEILNRFRFDKRYKIVMKM